MQNQLSEFRSRLEEMLGSCGIPRSIAADIEERLTPVTFERGAVIFLRGAPSDLLFWLLKGFVKLYLPQQNGDRILVDLARSGDFLGFIHAQDTKGPRHLLEARALTKCSVGLLPRDQIGPILSKLDRTATIHLLDQLNSAWSTMFERYIYFLGSPLPDPARNSTQQSRHPLRHLRQEGDVVSTRAKSRRPGRDDRKLTANGE